MLDLFARVGLAGLDDLDHGIDALFDAFVKGSQVRGSGVLTKREKQVEDCKLILV